MLFVHTSFYSEKQHQTMLINVIETRYFHYKNVIENRNFPYDLYLLTYYEL
jgi:hypothetical protein